MLLEADADPNVQAKSGVTPLFWSAGKGHSAAVAALLGAGADPNVRIEARQTPLHFAAIKGDTRTIAALTNAGADPSILDSELLKAADLLD